MRFDVREFLGQAEKIPLSEAYWLFYPWTMAMPFIREQGSLP